MVFMLQESSFRSMNTQIQVILAARHEMSEFEPLIQSYFAKAERRFSRFLPSSECSRLNRNSGSRCMISDEMANVLELCQHYFEVTEGAFNIFILPALEQAGYQRSFETISNDDECAEACNHSLLPLSEDRLQIDLDTAMSSVRFPGNQQMDLGGIVKSWTVQGLSELLRVERQMQRGLVNAGGDVEVWGGATDTDPWVIAIDRPNNSRIHRADDLLLLLVDGAVATSSTQKRSWRNSGGSMHHLIDPSTMKPSRSSVIQCSVVGEHLVDCEIWAKVMCIRGLEEGLPLFRRHAQRLEALIYTEDGTLHHVNPCANKSTGQWLGLEADFVHV
ncbi:MULTISPECIES: FAD:protein FMN transferase [Paenibacillus]|uniref:FAD:protein FMN transferase n=2 Tax=Paenibacillus TaxID=44249 RepID=A0ABU3RLR8_9BACL|nr:MULTISPECIES: FAD:protein FMN transferase [Paenibacillus]MDU0205232.1 FAD:protein FMN transferase [Paenibacillus sp. PFR10]